MRTRALVWGMILVGICVVSLVLYFWTGNRQVKRVLFFPKDTTMEPTGEMRKVPRGREDEEDIEILVKELILGPVSLSLQPLLPKHTTVRTCMLRKKTLYLDFSPELIVGKEKTSLSVDETLSGVERTIRFNFPGIGDIAFFIDGELYTPAYALGAGPGE